jgi:hypothetical protein
MTSQRDPQLSRQHQMEMQRLIRGPLQTQCCPFSWQDLCVLSKSAVEFLPLTAMTHAPTNVIAPFLDIPNLLSMELPCCKCPANLSFVQQVESPSQKEKPTYDHKIMKFHQKVDQVDLLYLFNMPTGDTPRADCFSPLIFPKIETAVQPNGRTFCHNCP